MEGPSAGAEVFAVAKSLPKSASHLARETGGRLGDLPAFLASWETGSQQGLWRSETRSCYVIGFPAVSQYVPVPVCHRAYGFVCNSVYSPCAWCRSSHVQDSEKFCCAIFWAPRPAGSTQWCVGQALKQAMDDQIVSHLHPDLLVSHLRLRSWETWAVCLPLPWCAKRGPVQVGPLASTGI